MNGAPVADGARVADSMAADSTVAKSMAADPAHAEVFDTATHGATVLALGAYFQATPCLLDGSSARFGRNAGDLDHAEACRALEHEVASMLATTAGIDLVAHDLHPDFHSTRVAQQLAAQLGVPAVAVQHHHAHVAAVLAEHGMGGDGGAVLGLALDGVGLGSDGTPWGGELLRVAAGGFARLGHLLPLPLAGGDRAAREPWRMAAAVLQRVGRGHEIARRFAHRPAAAGLAAILARPDLCPSTSSLGRHFDAAAGLLGLCEVMQGDAEAAIALERAAAAHPPVAPDPGGWQVDAAGQLDLLPVLAGLVDEADAGAGAARFHATLVAALVEWVRRAAQAGGVQRVVLCGGCLHNRLLADGLRVRLSEAGLQVLGARRLSPGDASLALGQAWVARQCGAPGSLSGGRDR